MGHWVSVYSDAPERLGAVVASGSAARLEEVLVRNPGWRSDQNRLSFLRRLIDGDFGPGEHPDGGRFVDAFQAICRACASKQATVEIYVDEDLFPEMWDFVWGGADAPQGLPMSEQGSPAVGFWDAALVREQIGVMEGLDRAALAARNRGHRYDSEIAALLAVLRAADADGRGVYVFFNE